MAQKHSYGGPLLAEPLRLISEISGLVTRVSPSALPDVLCRILRTTLLISGVENGVVFLLDYLSNELHTQGKQLTDLPILPPPETPAQNLGADSTAISGPNSHLSIPVVSRLGLIGVLLVFSKDESIRLTAEQENLLTTIANLAAIAIERCKSQKEEFRRLDAFSKIFAATQVGGAELLQEIANTALRATGADFVVLYEYFEERDDVRLPPTCAGELHEPSVLHGRSVINEHKRSAVFHLLDFSSPFYASDAHADWRSSGLLDSAPDEERSFFKREHVHSSAGLPLCIEAERVGVLFVNYRKKQEFPLPLRDNLELFANQASLAIGTSRFCLRSQRYSRNLEALNRIGREFGSALSLDIEQIGELIFDQTQTVIPTQNFFLCLYHAATDRLEIPYLRNERDRREDLEFQINRGLTAHVCRTGEPLLADWPHQERLFLAGTAAPVGSPSAVWLGAPLIVRNEVIGVLVVQDYRDETKFNAEHLHLLTAIASQAAIAIDNHRLLREAKRRLTELSAIIEAGPNAIVAVNNQGHVTEFNEGAAHLFKYTKHEILGKNVTTLYRNGFTEARRVQRLLLAHGNVKREILGRSKEGQIIPISLAAAILKDEDNNTIGSVGILEDLRLQALRGRIKLLVHALHNISAEEDLGNISDLVVLSAVELLYADSGCLLLRDDRVLFEVFSPIGHDNSLLEIFQASVHDGWLSVLVAGDPRQALFLSEPEIGRGPRLCADTRSSALVPLRTDAHLLGFLYLESREVDHLDADQLLIDLFASQAAVSINRVQLLRYREETRKGLFVSANAVMVGQIATSFIHEAKNSLNGMTLTVHNLLEDIESEVDLGSKKDYINRLSMLLSEMSRLDDLSRRLQKFTSQGLQPDKREVYINETIKRSLQLLSSALRKKQMRFDLHLDPALDPPSAKGRSCSILADDWQIQQVLINLVLNAIDASSHRKPLRIETRNAADHVKMSVTDYGAGIPKEVRKILFQPFATTKKGGVGLGLFISRLLVEDNHGGSIEVNSSPGKGSTFSVRLPR